MSRLYSFVLSMYVNRSIGEAKVHEYATKGYITQDEAELIIATPQV